MSHYDNNTLIQKLAETHSLSLSEYQFLITHRDADSSRFLTALAVDVRKKFYGNRIFIRGLIEISNICKNDCLYCGIRKSNTKCRRYRLTHDEILNCCREGYALGFRTFVLQGGEDGAFTDDALCQIIKSIKQEYPDCAVTLSLGERSFESFRTLFDTGADRYLLRHETADADHYALLHPSNMQFQSRMQALKDLKAIGYQTGCGFMVGSPFQTPLTLAKDLKFIEEFAPDMCGIGPFLPHHATPFAKYPAGSAELTCFLLSVIRLIRPNILLPATTALGSLSDDGRRKGILAGANVIMPNLSPQSVRADYQLYDNKKHSGSESAQGLSILKHQFQSVGYEIVTDRGDIYHI